jgi:CRISPR-associated protein Csb2
MALTISIELIRDLYCGNPWDVAHIEGATDWPPSPWRILRAFQAGAFLAHLSEVDFSHLDAASATLARVKPVFYLPQSAYFQSRTVRLDQDGTTNLYTNGKTVVSAELRFDAQDRTVWVQWPVDLNTAQHQVLDKVLRYCRYLGRREADALWLRQPDEDMPPANAFPESKGDRLCMVPNEDFLPEHLRIQPADNARAKRANGMGATWCMYRIIPKIEQFTPLSDAVQTNRCRIHFRGNYSPHVKTLTWWTDKLHKTLAKLGTPAFTGSELSHDHVFLIPGIVKDYFHWIDVVGLAPFTHGELEHLLAITALYGDGSLMPVLPELLIEASQSGLAWETHTPFYLTRYPLIRRGRPRLIDGTRYQKDGPEHQALKYLLFLPQFQYVEGISFSEYQGRLCLFSQSEPFAICAANPWQGSYKWPVEREKGKLFSKQGYWLSIEFFQPVTGPIALGYACHFGLGSLGIVREPRGVQSQNRQRLNPELSLP